MFSFWKNASIMAFAEVFLKLKALIMMPFITRYFGTVNYGIWSQVMVIVSLVSPLVFCGMENSLARFLPGQSIEKQREDFTGWFLFGLSTSVVLFLLISVTSGLFSELFFGTRNEYSSFVVLAGMNIVTTSLLTGIRNWFRVQNAAWSLGAITIIQNLLQMVVLIWILIQGLGIYELVLWSLVLDAFLMGIYVLYLLKTKVFSKPSLKWLKPYFRFGIMLLPSGYAIWVLNSLDRVFLAQYHTLSDIGVYSICFTIGYTLIQVVVNPIWVLFPTKAAELYNVQKFNDLNILFNQSLKLICWLIFPAILGLLIIGDQLMKFLTTDAFAAGYTVVPIILSGYLFLMLSAYFESILSLKNKPYLSTVFTVLACLLNIILNFLLIPKYSYMGAAVATTLSFTAQLFLSAVFALKEDLVTLDRKPILKILASSLLMFLVTWAAKAYWFESNSVLSFFTLISLGIMTYAALTYVFKIYSITYFMKFLKGDLPYA
jgi:O-antigen/teichoic acid export membrane protein